MIKILHLISSAGFFGAENMVAQLAVAQKKNGSCHPVVGVFKNSLHPLVKVEEDFEKKGVETITIPCRGKADPSAIFKVRRLIRDTRVDIIHGHGYKSNTYAFFASLPRTTRRVATCHNWLGESIKMKSYAALDRFLLRRFDAVAAVSNEVKDKLLLSGVSPEKITIIRNGIETSVFQITTPKREMKIKFNIPEDYAVIGTVGRISEEKGHRYMLAAAKTILDRYPKTIFIIIGDGPLRDELESEFGSQRIRFTGLRSDTPQWYHCMDIFVLPSLTEGLPLVVLEAMASGLPVVATRVGSVPTVVKESETGLLVEPGDANAIRMSLAELLNKPDQARKMGDEGRKRVTEHYSAEGMASDYAKIYHRLTSVH
jgi:glycosyltransferase involved in cell wall biosynthesis